MLGPYIAGAAEMQEEHASRVMTGNESVSASPHPGESTDTQAEGMGASQDGGSSTRDMERDIVMVSLRGKRVPVWDYQVNRLVPKTKRPRVAPPLRVLALTCACAYCVLCCVYCPTGVLPVRIFEKVPDVCCLAGWHTPW
jgi:hypothetical protein